MTTKPYNTTAEQPTAHDRPHHRPVLEMVAVWMLAAVSATVAVLLGGVALSMDASTRFTGTVQLALGIVALLFLAAAVALFGYARLEHGVAYGRRERATKSGDEWVINLKREIPVSDRGTVEMEPTRVKLPVAPKRFVGIVREMMRTGLGVDERPAGVSQPLRTKVLRALEDMDGATNGGPGVGWQLSDDLDALLKDIEQW